MSSNKRKTNKRKISESALLLVNILVSASIVLGSSIYVARAQETPLFSFTVSIPTGYEREYATALVIKDSLAKNGILMEVVKEDAGTLFSKLWGPTTYRLTYKEGGYDASSYWWSWNTGDMLYFTSFTPKGFPPNGWNEWTYNNAVVDEMLTAAQRTYDKTERKTYYDKFTEEWQRDPPFLALYNWDISKAARADIKGYNPILYAGDAGLWIVEGKTAEDQVTVRVAVPYTENYLDPIFGMSSSSPQYAQLVPCFRHLMKGEVQPDGSYKLVPDLAESYDISDDGKSVTFHLRKDVKWSDGVPFTSEDVKVSIEGQFNPVSSAPGNADLKGIIGIDTPDPYTAIFRMENPNALLFVCLGGGVSGALAPAHIFGKVPLEKWRGYWTNPSQVVTDGPYKIVDFVPNERTVLEVNPYYYGPKPQVDRIEYVVIQDYATAISALQKHEVDILIPEFNGPELTAAIPELQKAGIDTTWIPYPVTSYLGFNLNHPILTNRYVRLAIANLIPVDQILNDILKGHGKAASGPIFYGSWAFNPSFPPQCSYNPEKAKEYLAMAGYTPRTTATPITEYIYPIVSLIVGVALGFGIASTLKKHAEPTRDTQTGSETAK